MSKFKQVYRFLLGYLKGWDYVAKISGVTLGENCRVYIRDFGTEPFLISIGNNVTITSGVRFLTHDGATSLIKNDEGSRYQLYGGIQVQDDVFIGVNSIIMPGVKIGRNTIIGAGSVVTRDIEGNGVYAGSPAKLVRTFDEYREKITRNCANNEELIDISCYQERVQRALDIQSSK
uniref:Putative acetyltransferase n=1 Tax=Vibrio parahaemolyticus TaxID=670 RepID=A0A7M1W8V2_VIBPH|nr:putative acetyltransferase [Vibrio parahaemolyticus]